MMWVFLSFFIVFFIVFVMVVESGISFFGEEGSEALFEESHVLMSW